jgi:hypothetical protein
METSKNWLFSNTDSTEEEHSEQQLTYAYSIELLKV